MPSPFPGMDPYLEGHLWPGFHGALCTEVTGQLAPKVAPRYYPYSVRYEVLEYPEGVAVAREQFVADVGVSRQDPKPVGAPLATLEPPMRMHVVMPTPIPHYRIEIRDLEERSLVTAIEFLSPSNKRLPGRKKYLQKRQRLLSSDAHLIEIDLLRKGHRLPMREPFPPTEYCVLIGRANTRPTTDVWPISLRQPLPTIPVPLLAGDPDVPLDLQRTIASTYDRMHYELAINYRKRPDVPLTPEQEAWADALLRAAGLRS